MTELLPCLKLVHTKGIGPKTAAKLFEFFGSYKAVTTASAGALRDSRLSEKKIESLLSEENQLAVDVDLRWAEAPGNYLLAINDPGYPERLRRIPDPPLVLYVKGDPEVLQTPQLAIVGSRNPTPSGSETAFEFAKYLAQMGLTITSGMALGIDAAAHRGTLAQNGLTIAVAATGLDRVYPAQHESLAHSIIEEGVIVSEMPIGTRPRAEFFPRRNRIISGLSLGTLVIEAAMQSGSLSTARHSAEQNREVFAIPGSIHSPQSRGCHHLIRQGAKLVETADHVLEEIGALVVSDKPPAEAENTKEITKESPVKLDASYQQLLAAIDFSPQSIDRLIERCGLPAKDVSSMLLILELDGHINAVGGGKYTRRPSSSTTK